MVCGTQADGGIYLLCGIYLLFLILVTFNEHPRFKVKVFVNSVR